jgi:hypothetical protein
VTAKGSFKWPLVTRLLGLPLPVLVGLAQWGSEHLFEPGEPRSVLVDAVRNRPLAKLQIRSEDGRVLQPNEVLVRIPSKE